MGIAVNVWKYVQIILKRNSEVPEIVDIGYCMSCGQCVSICSANAIIHQIFLKGVYIV